MPSYNAGLRFIKVGEDARLNTYVKPKPVPEPKNHDQSWQQKSGIMPWWGDSTEEANNVSAAWLKHPANRLQLPGLQKAHDTDGDGLIDTEEFKSLLKAAGSSADASILFEAMDADGDDGVLTEAEIKALGQDRDGRSKIRG